jgi:hypothetical protein
MRANRKLNDAADEALQAIRTSTTPRTLINLSDIP